MGEVIRPQFGTQFDQLGELAEKIKALIFEHAGEVPLVAVLGVLRVVEHDLIEEHRDD